MQQQQLDGMPSFRSSAWVGRGGAGEVVKGGGGLHPLFLFYYLRRVALLCFLLRPSSAICGASKGQRVIRAKYPILTQADDPKRCKKLIPPNSALSRHPLPVPQHFTAASATTHLSSGINSTTDEPASTQHPPMRSQPPSTPAASSLDAGLRPQPSLRSHL